MSEFKFACPVCGQHMMCDESHGGSVMECPTCFQKIVAPQAPAPDAKFILTGTQLSEKKILVRGLETPDAAAKKKFPVAAVLLVAALLLALGVGVFLFRGDLLAHHYAWKTVDVGSVQLPGSFSQTGGKLTVAGSGADIWSRNDAFHYACLELDGNGMITARVLGLMRTDPWAKAGVMFRETLEADAKFALAAVTPENGITFQLRKSTDGEASAPVITHGVTAPQWFRLKRTGNTFTAEVSSNGTAWTRMGAAKIAMNRRVFVGLAVCSHNSGALCRAQFDHVYVQGNILSGPATNAAPPKPKLVAPPASDTNWTMKLDEVATPKSAVVGRIHGQNFILERAVFQNGDLILRQGTHGPVDFGLSINFNGARPKLLAGKSIHVQPEAAKAARVTLHWRDSSGAVQSASFNDKYAMRLEFGPLARGRLPGKIYLCLPDAEKSYLMGTFNAAIVRSRHWPAH